MTSVYSEVTLPIKGVGFCLLLGDLNLITTVHSDVLKVMQLKLVWYGWLWLYVLICSTLVVFWIRFGS